MGRIALDKPDRAARLATWRDQLGVRLNFGPREAPWFTECVGEVVVGAADFDRALSIP